MWDLWFFLWKNIYGLKVLQTLKYLKLKMNMFNPYHENKLIKFLLEDKLGFLKAFPLFSSLKLSSARGHDYHNKSSRGLNCQQQSRVVQMSCYINRRCRPWMIVRKTKICVAINDKEKKVEDKCFCVKKGLSLSIFIFYNLSSKRAFIHEFTWYMPDSSFSFWESGELFVVCNEHW